MADHLSIFATTPNTTTERSTKSPHLDIPIELLYGIYVFNGFLALIGLLGNVFVCLVIVRGRKMYTIANLFLMNLAIADLFVLGLCYPLWIMQEVAAERWPFGSALCKIIPPLSDVFFGVSLGCMIAISFHRYRMIIHSMRPQMEFVQAKAIIIFLYGISLLTISAPVYPIMTYSEYSKNITTLSKDFTTNSSRAMDKKVVRICSRDWPSWTYERCYLIYLTVVWYVIPLLIILDHYVRIKWYLKKHISCKWVVTSLDDITRQEHALGIKKALRLLAPVVIVFAIAWLPWNILRIIAVFQRLEELHYIKVYLLISATMLVFNSAVNPIIYYMMSNDFRIEFHKKLSDASLFFRPAWSKEDVNNDDKRRRSTNMSDVEAEFENNNGYANTIQDFDDLFSEYQRNKEMTTMAASMSTNLSCDEGRSMICNDVHTKGSGDDLFIESCMYDLGGIVINYDRWNKSAETVL